MGQPQTALGGQHLPGDQVGVVLHHGQDDQVPGTQLRPSPGRGDQVDRFGGVAREDELGRIGRADEGGNTPPGRLVGLGGLFRQPVDAAMDVGVLVLVEVGHRLEHGPRLLGRGGRIEVDQVDAGTRFAIQYREFGAQPIDV